MLVSEILVTELHNPKSQEALSDPLEDKSQSLKFYPSMRRDKNPNAKITNLLLMFFMQESLILIF